MNLITTTATGDPAITTRISNRFAVVALLLIACGSFTFDSAEVSAQEAKTIAGWGQVVDPDGDCKISEKEGVVTVEVPNTLHDLNQRNGKLNAPRVLQQVDGDFRIEVTVSGKFKPGKDSTAANSTAFNSAGILLWHNEKSNVRLERNSFGGGYCFPPLFELRNKGKYFGANPAVAPDTYFKGTNTSLRIERHGNVFTAFIRHGNEEWTLVKSRSVDLPKKLKVGISAINTSSDPMTVKFKDLKVTEISSVPVDDSAGE